ncbi:hypothetical protein L332_04910 [Agrococcus pavilionensis RW1]|uniref:Tyr recombinase domain-containing protein n=1 Tax=Agrococcus pavilionensis RW1 TaxID=1330458 RepID=U1L9W7_9MICO|nr:tyrosine-type recombinase/integrase [Agrococcus pavilionensis]ERG63793.1 hypothetical protein L332_04910 [Agrococcus pavilionensis RW1]
MRFSDTRSGRVSARSQYRDFAGVIHHKRATGDSREDAERKLRASVVGSARGEIWLTLDSKIGELGHWWLAGLRSLGAVQRSTLQNYEYDARIVEVSLREVRLRELTARVVDGVVTSLAESDPARARRLHSTLGRMCDEAVRMGILDENPVDRVRAPRKAKRLPYALGFEQTRMLRSELAAWLKANSRPGPQPDQRIAIMVDVMIASSARIGELLALRHCDVDLYATPPTLLIGATLVDDERGVPSRQAHTKDERQKRVIVLPPAIVAALEPLVGSRTDEAPIFGNRKGSWKRAGTVQRVLREFVRDRRDVLEAVGIRTDEITPHLFRRISATLIAAELGVYEAQRQLGHASVQTTERHYVMPAPLTGAAAAETMDRLFESIVADNFDAA